jgi:tetratricopeptide (TPR) repeat protein
MFRRAAFILAIFVTVSGCAQMPTRPTAAPVAPADPKSLLTLDQIPPPAVLPPPRPTTQPDQPAPVQALSLYAAARDAMIDNRPLGAVDLLQQAIALDPDSFELYRALGEARLAAAGRPNQEAVDAFQKAVDLRPDDLRIQALLASQYAALGNADQALTHLRLAMLTSDYQEDDVTAAAVDLLLGRLLQELGYDRAAEDQYLALIHRLANPSYALRSDTELGALVDHPQALWLEVGYLREKHHHWADALAVYQPLADADPDNFQLQAKVVSVLGNLGRHQEAVRKAIDAVTRFDASSESVDLLKSTCRRGGQDVIVTLRVLLKSAPADRSLKVALSDVLAEQGQTREAQEILESIVAAHDADQQIVSKLFALYMRQDDVASAARLLIVYLAAHPDLVGEIEPWWSQLMRPANPLRLATLQGLDVDRSAAAAKAFLVWRLADTWRRDALAHSALETAVESGSPFGPAFRQLTDEYWAREDWNSAQKLRASQALADAADKGGDAALACEVRGLAMLDDKKPADAAALFEQALVRGGSSPQLLLTYASALRQIKQDVKAEQLLWKLVGQRPHFDEAWAALFQFYITQQQIEPARRVLAQWLGANPESVQAGVLQADFAAEEGNPGDAEAILLKLFGEHEDDPDVISALVSLGRRTGRLDMFIRRLEDLRQAEPTNAAVVEQLVEIYADEGRGADAARVLDETRAVVAKDPDLLYQIAHLYELVDQPETANDVLEQVVALDPNHASACNDLGYSWADEGRNLDRAAALISVAVAQEPDNQSYLDSMGWVLYKQGRYAQAESYMEKAVGPALRPDPVVLNHYGDILYRLGRADEAVKQWQRSLAGLDQESPDRDDLKSLRLTLLRKLQQQKQGTTVSVAPVVAR